MEVVNEQKAPSRLQVGVDNAPRLLHSEFTQAGRMYKHLRGMGGQRRRGVVKNKNQVMDTQVTG